VKKFISAVVAPSVNMARSPRIAGVCTYWNWKPAIEGEEESTRAGFILVLLIVEFTLLLIHSFSSLLQSTGNTFTENPNHTRFGTKYSLKYSISKKT
jgi:hypothetical protein